MNNDRNELRACDDVIRQLRRTANRLVLAESCTVGLIAASLGHFPGVSEVLAGSLVAYQVSSKVEWLGVGRGEIESFGVVSREIAEAMALGALRTTPHATVSLSVTGHVGPNAPSGFDGVIWTAIATGHGVRAMELRVAQQYAETSEELEQQILVRRNRQSEVVRKCLMFLYDKLASESPDKGNS